MGETGGNKPALEKLSEGGEKSQCGWLKGKYGVLRQIVPETIDEMLKDPEIEKSKRVSSQFML